MVDRFGKFVKVAIVLLRTFHALQIYSCGKVNDGAAVAAPGMRRGGKCSLNPVIAQILDNHRPGAVYATFHRPHGNLTDFGAALIALAKHHHQNEHFTVVDGQAVDRG